MNTQVAHVTRFDTEARAVLGSTPLAPCYLVAVDGEKFPMYFATDRSTALPSLQLVPEDSTHLVAFLPDDDTPSWWWADHGGADSREAAETLLAELSDGRPGKGFVIAAPPKEMARR